MPKRLTAEIANSNITNGEKLYQDRARKALPYLVRQAKAGQTISYSDLAQEIGMPNPRNLNYVLGSIGNALIQLCEQEKIEIPPIQLIVVNKQEELPGAGVGWFIKSDDFAKLNRTQKQKIIDAQLALIYIFPSWDWVLEKLNLEPVAIDFKTMLEEIKRYRGGGESDQHKKFKELIANNPALLGLNKRVGRGKTEYPLPSADTVDVVFEIKEQIIGVEVKSIISDKNDIMRGLFQCVKYKYLIEAEQAIKNRQPNSRVILALEGCFPAELSLAKNLLGIEVIDNIKISH